MSKLLGEIRQLGYVVPDIEAAMHHWSSVMGVGPFFYNPKVPIEGYTYGGEAFEVRPPSILFVEASLGAEEARP